MEEEWDESPEMMSALASVQVGYQGDDEEWDDSPGMIAAIASAKVDEDEKEEEWDDSPELISALASVQVSDEGNDEGWDDSPEMIAAIASVSLSSPTSTVPQVAVAAKLETIETDALHVPKQVPNPPATQPSVRSKRLVSSKVTITEAGQGSSRMTRSQTSQQSGEQFVLRSGKIVKPK